MQRVGPSFRLERRTATTSEASAILTYSQLQSPDNGTLPERRAVENTVDSGERGPLPLGLPESAPESAGGILERRISGKETPHFACRDVSPPLSPRDEVFAAESMQKRAAQIFREQDFTAGLQAW
jgi:hypothetical protein